VTTTKTDNTSGTYKLQGRDSKFVCEILKETSNLEDADAGSKWISRVRVLKRWTRFYWLRIQSKAGFCEHGYELSASIKRGIS
jgi:hypothetical protein